MALKSFQEKLTRTPIDEAWLTNALYIRYQVQLVLWRVVAGREVVLGLVQNRRRGGSTVRLLFRGTLLGSIWATLGLALDGYTGRTFVARFILPDLASSAPAR